MKRNLFTLTLATLTVGTLISGVQAQTINNLKANELQADGSYLWRYQVFNNAPSNKDISHWVLGLCSNAYGSIVSGSVKEGASLSSLVVLSPGTGYVNHTVTADPATGAKGIKFDQGFDGFNSKIVEFRLSADYGVTTTTATFKAAGNVTSVSGVVAPSCTVQQRIPEPGSLALLGVAGLALGATITRRRK